MNLWVLVYAEHYEKFRQIHRLEKSEASLQRFLREIGTPLVVTSKPFLKEESSYMEYLQVPKGSCVFLRRPQAYAQVVRERLFPDAHEKQDKSRRSSSCSII